VEAAEKDILAGNDVFCGPIMAQDGSVLVAEGTCMSDADQLSLATFVEGVVGTIE
jgi:basic membrane protein A